MSVENANDRSKDEFLAILAHELRNPLAPIRSALDVLSRTIPPRHEVEWALGVIDRQLGQMTRLIDDVVDLARMTTNKLQLRKRRIGLDVVLDAAVETSRPLIEACGHELAVTRPTQPMYVDADPCRLLQVIVNLLNNAAKYTERGGHIALVATRDADDAVVTVRDTGIGIAAETLPRIFDLFTQADRSLHLAQGGFGVGLALVKRLVEMHGGAITARSDGQGTGSEFSVRLPVAAALAT